MAKKLVDTGLQPDDNTGDPLRDAFNKINDNFNEVYSSLGDGTDLGLAIDDDGNIDINNDLTVTGNLVVNGNTTTVSSETVTFEDNILLINKADGNDDGYSSVSSGIEIDTTGTNPSFIHTFSDSLWTLSDAFKVDGNAGLGTSPEANTRLLIHGYGANASTIALHIKNNNGTASLFKFKDNGTLDWGGGSDAGTLMWDSNEAVVRGQSGKGLRLAANGVLDNHIYIATDGDVGIGTNTPGAKLDVDGDIVADNITLANSIIHEGDTDTNISFTDNQINLNAGGGKSGIFIQNTIRLQESDSSNIAVDLTGGSSNGLLRLYSNNSDAVTITGNGNSYFNGGNVGIGTTSPNYELTVGGGSVNSIQILSSSTGSGADNGLRFWNTGNSTAIWNYDNTPTLFGTNNEERMRIDSSGNVGIDINNPTTRLAIAAPSSTSVALGVHYSSSSTNKFFDVGILDNDGYLHLRNSSAQTTIHLDSDGDSFINGGNVGIGTGVPSSKLDVNGTIAFNSLKDSGEDITITKFVDEADTIASNNNDTTIPTSAAVDAHIKSKSSTDRTNNYKIMGLAMDYLSRVHNDGGTVEGMENVMKNTEELILA